MKLKLITAPNKILNKKCDPIHVVTQKHLELAASMLSHMKKWGGVGLAAPQIGRNIRLIVVNDGSKQLVLFNPEIIFKSQDSTLYTEQCLSFPGISIELSRPITIAVRYLNVNNTIIEQEFTNLMARIIQHECLPRYALIQTENDGLKSIKWIVENKYNGKVLSLNLTTNTLEYKKILNFSVKRNKNKKKWISLSFSNENLRGGPNKKLITTEEHLTAYVDNPFDFNIKYDFSKNLLNKYLIRQINNKKLRNKELPLYNKEQLSALLGSVLGDLCISSAGELICSHGSPQKDYSIYKSNIFNGKIIKGYSGYRNEFSNYMFKGYITEQTKYIRKELYNNKKNLQNFYKFEEYFNAISLAFWFMDDGSYRKKDKYALFHTEGFTKEDVLYLIDLLKRKFDINSVIQRRIIRNKEMYCIRLTQNDTKKLFDIISPHIHPSMYYKIENNNINFIEINNKPLDYSLKLINSINNIFLESKLYDLTIEDNNNFFANSSLVHNCDHLDGITFDQIKSS